MTDATENTTKPPLGVGNILGESFSVSFQNIFGLAMIFLIAFLPPIALMFALVGSVLFDPAGQEEFWTDMVVNNPVAFWTGYGLFFIVGMLIGCFYFAAAIRLIFSARMGARAGILASLGSGFSATPRLFVTLTVFTILLIVVFSALGGGSFAVIGIALGPAGSIVGIVLGIGFFVLYLWVIGVFAPLASASVLENRWFSAIGRSISLTKGYRWPIVGLMVLVFLAIFVVSLILGVVSGLLSVLGIAGVIIGTILQIALSVVLYGVMVACITLIYARLVEIKEGRSIENLADVFS